MAPLPGIQLNITIIFSVAQKGTHKLVVSNNLLRIGYSTSNEFLGTCYLSTTYYLQDLVTRVRT